MKPSPKSLILDLLSTLRRGAMPVRALVAAGEIFAISQNSLRVSLARLCNSGQVERDARGRYRLGDAARAIDDHVQSWRRAPERMRDWELTAAGRGTWVAAFFYSLIESAKLCGVEPRAYLREAALRAVRNPGTVTLARELKSSEC